MRGVGNKTHGNNSRRQGLPRTGPRILICFLPLFLMLATLVVRAMVLQVLPHEKLEKFMHRLEPSSMTLAQVNRGMILDRNGRELAVNINMKSVYIDPVLFKADKHWHYYLRRIAQITGESHGQLQNKLRNAARFLWVSRHLKLEVAEKVRALNAPGLFFVDESKRSYPQGVLAAHLLGFTNLDGDGIEGLEFTYNKLLRGEPGKLLGQRDAKGRRLLIGGITQEGRAGQNLTLTIDSVLQYIVERELDQAISETGAKGAMGLILHPETGELLAMANRPTFDPNHYKRAAAKLWRNRAVADQFEPGSTFKPLMVAWGIDHQRLSQQDRFYCKYGSFTVGRKVINETHKELEWLTTPEVLKYSSNIGAAKIALSLGPQTMYQLIEDFGFGAKTEVGLPGEALGMIQPASRWTEVDTASSGFGQGFSVTALQLGRAFGALVNGGKLVRPYIALHSQDPKSHRLTRLAEKKQISQPLTSKHADEMRAMLVDVVESDGTGKRAALAHYSVGGKTGTAQLFDTKSASYHAEDYISSFVGYLPVDKPELLILVVIEQPEGLLDSGGLVAAPVFKRIAEQSADYLGLLPDNPDSQNAPLAAVENLKAPAEELQATAALKTFDGMSNIEFKNGLAGLTVREVLQLANRQGVAVMVSGSGFATGKVVRDRKVANRLWVEFSQTAKRKF